MPENPEASEKLYVDRLVGDVFVTHPDGDNYAVFVRGIEERVFLHESLTDDGSMIPNGLAYVRIERDQEGELVMHEHSLKPGVHVEGAEPWFFASYSEIIQNETDKPRMYMLKLNGKVMTQVVLTPGVSGNISWYGTTSTPNHEWAVDELGIVTATDEWLTVFNWTVLREARRQLALGTNASRARAVILLDGLLAGAPSLREPDVGELVNREGAAMENVIYHATMRAAERFNPDESDPGWSAEMHEDEMRDACLAYVQSFLTRRAQHG